MRVYIFVGILTCQNRVLFKAIFKVGHSTDFNKKTGFGINKPGINDIKFLFNSLEMVRIDL
jgi:hypothetical protein